MTRLEKMIRVYAFLNNVDYDTAAYRVVVDLIRTIDNARSVAGLYDRMFGEENAAQQN